MHLLSFSLIAMVAGSLVATQQLNNRDHEAVDTLTHRHTDTASPEELSLYRFQQPDRAYILPAILKEISGITLADVNTMYCIQDENGIVYKYDLRKGEIVGDIPFGGPGDYEDLTMVNGEIHVLRSDARVFRVNQKRSSNTTDYHIAVSCTNVEGLYYSAAEDVTYVACKSPIVDHDGNLRSVFQFSSSDPDNIVTTIVISEEDVVKFFPDISQKSKKQKMSFNPSAIAVHPLNGDLYVLSATQRYIGIFSEGLLQNMFALPADIYYQPEGITFSDDGDLYISSEGSKDGKLKATIHFLRQQE